MTVFLDYPLIQYLRGLAFDRSLAKCLRLAGHGAEFELEILRESWLDL